MDDHGYADFWQDLSPSRQIDYFKDWLSLENLLGEFGDPGFSEITKHFKWPTINPDDPLPYTFTCYRNEAGLLVGVFVNYPFGETIKPFTIMTHPDHQRNGVGTKLADFVISKFEETTNTKFGYKSSWGDARATEAAANWANKYVRSIYERTFSGENLI